jgi:HEAT repeat protein
VRARVAAGVVAAAVAWVASTGAQQRVVPHPLPKPAFDPAPTPKVDEGEQSLRATLGMDRLQRLLRSGSGDDVARGIQRLSALDTPEAFALLLRAAAGASATGDGISACARRSPKALLGVVRALARYVDREAARKALLEILRTTLAQLDTGAPAADPEGAQVRAGRVLLARQEAALALAMSGSTAAEEQLVAVARGEEVPEESAAAALVALAAQPPQSPMVFGGVALTTPGMVRLAAKVGDLRTLDAILGMLKASDPVLRAAALDSLGELGDARVLDAARTAVHDPVAGVRVSAAGALVHLGVADAPAAVEALVADETTAIEGLRLASEVQGEGVTRAAAARAAASSDRAIRAAAIEALGRQTSPSAITALGELGRDPNLRADAADALAYSPSDAAVPALEAMAGRPDEARMAARAYFVRRFVRGARSRGLDDLLARLAASPSARDRVVGVEALVALGERPIDGAIADPDPRVRAAAAMGAAAHLDGPTSDALLARMAVEPDAATRVVLALGLARGDDRKAVAASALVDRVRSGGPDAPLAALALARRSTGPVTADVAALLESHDPVMRAHAARGLGACQAPDAAGLLADAYTNEVDARVRRAIIEALAVRAPPVGPGADAALALAARLDPDAAIRSIADRAVRGAPAGRAITVPEVAWVSLVAVEGAVLPTAATATIVDAGGLALPIAFDDDGLALEPGLPPGPYRLRLAPRMPPYTPPSP